MELCKSQIMKIEKVFNEFWINGLGPLCQVKFTTITRVTLNSWVVERVRRKAVFGFGDGVLVSWIERTSGSEFQWCQLWLPDHPESVPIRPNSPGSVVPFGKFPQSSS